MADPRHEGAVFGERTSWREQRDLEPGLRERPRHARRTEPARGGRDQQNGDGHRYRVRSTERIVAQSQDTRRDIGSVATAYSEHDPRYRAAGDAVHPGADDERSRCE